MSAYQEYETEFKDLDCLLEALTRVNTRLGRNWTREDIEVHKEAVNLRGYQNDVRKDKANVIIRRGKVGGAANDLGFVKGESGGYTAIISSYDSGFYTKDWLNEVKKEYSQTFVERAAKRQGYRLQKKKVDGKIRMTLTRWK